MTYYDKILNKCHLILMQIYLINTRLLTLLSYIASTLIGIINTCNENHQCCTHRCKNGQAMDKRRETPLHCHT